MEFFRRLGINVPLLRARRIEHPCPHLLTDVTYTTATSDRGLPEMRLDLSFARRSGTTNPHMSLAMLVDRGGPFPARASGTQVVDVFAGSPSYVFTAPPSILHYISSYGADCDLAFYDNEVEPAGSIRQAGEFQAALAAHPPRGRLSHLPVAIAETVRRLGTDRGLYLLVWANGLTGDTVRLVSDQLQRYQSPDSGYGLRVHLVDTGAALTLGESLQVAREFSRAGPLPVRYQFGYSASGEAPSVDPSLVDTITDQLDRVFIGISGEVTVREQTAQGASTLLRVANLSANRWYEGHLCAIGFVPMRAQLALEFAAAHPQVAEIVIRYFDGSADQEIPLRLPLPPSVGGRPG